MIKLFLNGKAAALFTDTKIGITALNPYFNEVGAYSYPFTIPYMPNEGVLLHAARIQNTAQAKNFIWDAVLEVDGIQVLMGEAVAEGDFPILSGAFPLVLRSAKTSFSKQSELKKMNEMEFGIEANFDLSDSQLQNKRNNFGSYYPYSNYVVAPFYNSDAWGEERGKAKIPNYINQIDPVTGKLDDRIDRDNQYLWNVVTYSFYVRFILKRIIELSGLTLDQDDMSTIPDLNRWFCLSLTENLNHQDINFKYSFSETTVREFLRTIRQFGIAVIVDERKKTASIRLVRDLFKPETVNSLLNATALAETVVFSMPKDGYTIAYKDSGNDRSYKESSKDLAVQVVATNIVEVANFAALPVANGYYADYNLMHFALSTGTYYITVLQPKLDETSPDVYKWQCVGNFRPFVSGNGEEKIEIGATVLGQRNETRTITKSVYELGDIYKQTWDIDIEMPEFNQYMNESFNGGYKGDFNNPPLVFLFNWGQKVYYSPDPRIYALYPVITGDAYSRDGTEMGSISMRTNGKKSIIGQLAGQEQEWLLVRKQKRQFFNLSVAACASFRWQDTYNIGSINYLVNSLSFDITTKGISLVEAELYTV